MGVLRRNLRMLPSSAVFSLAGSTWSILGGTEKLPKSCHTAHLTFDIFEINAMF